MKLVVQRVSRASVRVDGRTVGEIGRGFLVLFGAEVGDAPAAAEEAARKVAGLRVFDDASVYRAFTSIEDFEAEIRALRGPEAEPLYERFVAGVRALGLTVATGVFGASMEVELVNEGPATFLLDVPPAP